MSRYGKRKFTGEAVLVGCLFSFFIGFIAGALAALVVNSVGVGLVIGVVLCLFSMDVIFNGIRCE